MAEGEKLIPINIEDEMKSAYIDYSMSVIVSRALPDVRDGLKPVHRRVLYGMHELGIRSSTATRNRRELSEKFWEIPPPRRYFGVRYYGAHGSGVEFALSAHRWAGNFGSVDGDSRQQCAIRSRMQKMSEDLLADIDKDTVEHQLNFDDTLKEPTVLPHGFLIYL